jgi:hypothetical protein
MAATPLRTWETPHLMTLASGSEATFKFWKVGEFIPFIFDDPEGTEPEGAS